MFQLVSIIIGIKTNDSLDEHTGYHHGIHVDIGVIYRGKIFDEIDKVYKLSVQALSDKF